MSNDEKRVEMVNWLRRMTNNGDSGLHLNSEAVSRILELLDPPVKNPTDDEYGPCGTVNDPPGFGPRRWPG